MVLATACSSRRSGTTKVQAQYATAPFQMVGRAQAHIVAILAAGEAVDQDDQGTIARCIWCIQHGRKHVSTAVLRCEIEPFAAPWKDHVRADQLVAEGL